MLGLRIRQVRNLPVVSQVESSRAEFHAYPLPLNLFLFLVCLMLGYAMDWLVWKVLGVAAGWEVFCIELKGIWPSAHKPGLCCVYSRHYHSGPSSHFLFLFYSPTLFTDTISLFSPKKETPKSGCPSKGKKSCRPILEQKVCWKWEGCWICLKSVDIKLENLDAKGEVLHV